MCCFLTYQHQNNELVAHIYVFEKQGLEEERTLLSPKCYFEERESCHKAASLLCTFANNYFMFFFYSSLFHLSLIWPIYLERSYNYKKICASCCTASSELTNLERTAAAGSNSELAGGEWRGCAAEVQAVSGAILVRHGVRKILPNSDCTASDVLVWAEWPRCALLCPPCLQALKLH